MGKASHVFVVNALTGLDDVGRMGTSEAPWRTLTFAFEQAARLVGGALPASGVELRLEGGRFGIGEDLPLSIPPGWPRLILDGGGEAELDGGAQCVPTLRATVSQALDLEVRGLSFRGGLGALSVAVDQGATVALLLRDCSFAGHTARAAEVSVGRGGRGDVEVRHSTFLGASPGVGVEALESASVRFEVEECRFEASCGGEVLPTAAVEAHFDSDATLEVVVERNSFHALSSAVQLTCGTTVVGAGRLDARVRGNLMEGLHDAVYLSLDSAHDLDLLVAQNTIVGTSRFVIFEDRLGAAVSALPPVPWTFANNICFGVGGPSEFAAEWAGEALREEFGSGSGGGPLVRNNRLEESLLGEGAQDNLRADPGFVRPQLPCGEDAGGPSDWRLVSSSPLLERGVRGYAEGLVFDLDGGCRFATVRGCDSPVPYAVDLGAYERAGSCREEVVFVRGDCSSSGDVSLAGFVSLLNFLFLGREAPPCPDACDLDDDGELTLVDSVRGLRYLFLGDMPPADPGVAGGVDPTCDLLPPCRG